jgi:uncharacterized protein
MRLLLDSNPGINLVRSYGNGELIIGEQRIDRPCIVAPHELHLDWDASSIEQLTAEDVEPALALKITILLLGAGDRQPWPSAAVRTLLRARGVALECMNLGAACRTYNILATEERDVAAGLFP